MLRVVHLNSGGGDDSHDRYCAVAPEALVVIDTGLDDGLADRAFDASLRTYAGSTVTLISALLFITTPIISLERDVLRLRDARPIYLVYRKFTYKYLNSKN